MVRLIGVGHFGLALLILAACNRAPHVPVAAPRTAAPIEQQWPNVAAVLQAAPDVPLQEYTVTLNDDMYVLQAPPGATFDLMQRDAVMIARLTPTAAFRVTRGAAFMRAEMQYVQERSDQVQAFPFFDDNLLVVRFQTDPAATSQVPYEACMNLSTEYRDYTIRTTHSGSISGNNTSLADLQLALKCAATLRPQLPYPTDPLELVDRLLLTISPPGPSAADVTAFDFPPEATASTLKVLQLFPQVRQVQLRDLTLLARPTDLALLAEVPLLQDLHLHRGPASSVAIAGRFEDIGACQNLERLRIEFVARLPTDVQSLAPLSRLRELSLRISEPGLNGLAELTTLTALQQLELLVDEDGPVVSMNLPFALGGRVAPLAALPALRTVALHARVKDADLIELSQLTQLTNLQLENSRSDPVPLSAAALATLPPGLTSLELNRFTLNEEATAALAQHPTLQTLLLPACELSGPALMKLVQLKSLRQISFFGSLGSEAARTAFAAARPDVKLSD